MSKVIWARLLSWGIEGSWGRWGGEGGADRRVPSGGADVLGQHSSRCSHLSMQQSEDWQHIASKNCLHLRVPQQWPAFCNTWASCTAQLAAECFIAGNRQHPHQLATQSLNHTSHTSQAHGSGETASMVTASVRMPNTKCRLYKSHCGKW